MKKAITIILALVFVLSMVPAAFAAESGPDTSNWTLVWDVENAPADLTPWNTDMGDGWGVSGNQWKFSAVDGKGVNGSKAMGVELIDNVQGNLWSRKSYVEFHNDTTAVTDWTGATEVMFYIDGSEMVGNVDDSDNALDYFSIDFCLEYDSTVDWTVTMMVKGTPWYMWENGQWTEKAVSDWGHLFLPEGYCGWVRVPISAFYVQPDLSNIGRFFFVAETRVDGSIYLDNLMINVAPESGDTTPDAPTTGGDTSTDEPAKTGDASLMIPAMLLATVSAACMVLVLKKKEF